ncbi:MAG: metallophosphoesterase, partial [Candidatus Thorarchaeota archaeon]|nr:metallophosphoesterase [Candidatus Thorarchaeota archaeon]
MKILAVADVHCPKFLPEFKKSLAQLSSPDVFFFAGDMINRGNASEYLTVLDSIENAMGSGFPIIACFGNEEYNEVRKEIVSIVGDRVLFLDEKSTVINNGPSEIGIIGTQGSLDKATSWQRSNIPSIKG